MNAQNKPINASIPDNPPVKRKRGRPRKDENIVKKRIPDSPVVLEPDVKEENSTPSITPGLDDMRRLRYVQVNSSNGINDSMVGRVVSGVVEGSFDSGYFLSVRIGNSSTVLRGVVFQPGLVTPVTPANDIAPQAKMYNRREISVPVFIPQNREHNVKQPVQLENKAIVAPNKDLPVLQLGVPSAPNNQSPFVVKPLIKMPNDDSITSLGKATPQQNSEFSFKKHFVAPMENLRMVEQDEVMQALEVSRVLEGPRMNIATKSVSESVTSGLTINILTGTETINYVPRVQDHTSKSGLEPSQVIPNTLKSQNLELLQSPLVLKSNPLSLEPHRIESELGQTDMLPNEQKKTVVVFHESPGVSKPHSMPPKLHFLENIHEPNLASREQEDPNIRLNQSPIDAESGSMPSESQSVEIGCEPYKLIHRDLKCNLDIHQTPVIAKPQSVPSELVSGSVNVAMQRLIPVMNDITQDMQVDPAAKVLSKVESFDQENPASDAVDHTQAGSLSAPRPEQPTTSKPELPAKESIHSGTIDSQISNSGRYTTNFDFVLGDTIPPIESHHLSNHAETEHS